jgi:MFS family permease
VRVGARDASLRPSYAWCPPRVVAAGPQQHQRLAAENAARAALRLARLPFGSTLGGHLDSRASYSVFAPLRHRNYRLLWLGLIISLGGSMMRNAAILWHVAIIAQPGERALALGIVGLVRVLPILISSLLAGAVADAFDRRRVLLVTNTAMLCISLALFGITLAGVHSLAVVYFLAALSSAAGSFDNPARNAFFPDLVPRDELARAISLNSVGFQAAAVTGPMLGGLLIAGPGLAWAYLADVLSFVVLLTSLLSMRELPPQPASGLSGVKLGAVRDGFAFVFRQPLIRGSMLLDAFATFFGSATALLPLYAQEVLQVGASGYGLLSSAMAAGAVVTSVLMVPLLGRIQARGPALIVAASGYGVCTMLFGISHQLWLSYLALFLAGASDMVSTALRQVIRHLNTPNAMRGRMSSVNMVFFMGGPQLGELEAGLVAQTLGPVGSVVSGGALCVLSVLGVAWFTPALRRYRRDLAGDIVAT